MGPLGSRCLAAGTHGPTLRELLTFLGSENTHHLDVAIARLLSNVRDFLILILF
jgi:serpin B